MIDYSRKKMSSKIVILFKKIYPDWSVEDLQRVTYDEKMPLHVATKLAVIDDKIIGQANVFRLQYNSNIANLGTHVHPKYQGKGIGRRFASEVIKEAKKNGISGIVIQTEKDNEVELKVAEKLGFSEASQAFIQENKNHLKLCRMIEGIILFKRI